MWQLDNRTPFAAERGWVRDRNGAEVWLVAVKCTFDISADGLTRVSKEQPPVLRLPAYNAEEGKSSIRFENDLVLTKNTTDAIVAGHAYAPGGRPVTELDAGFRVGPVQKLLKVFGDRHWGATGPSSPAAFVKMPLVYERGFGGVDPQSKQPDRDFYWPNPVGVGFAVSPEHMSGRPLPNIEYPDQLIAGWKDRPRPAGFGPIAGHWQPRVGFAGTYDDAWMQQRHPLPPADFDDRFFQCAPPDQQAPRPLRGGEPVVLHRLTSSGELRCLLPTVILDFVTQFADGTVERHPEPRLHTVILEPDYPRLSLVWHSALPCHFKVQKLERTLVAVRVARRAAPIVTAVDELEPA